VTYRIGRTDGPDGTVFGVSGEMDAEHALRLEILIEEVEGAVFLDLKDVTLVARDAVRFLARMEAGGIGIVNCPEYVRSWIAAEKRVRSGSPG